MKLNSLSILLYPLAVCSRAIFLPISGLSGISNSFAIRRSIKTQAGIEFWSSTPPEITCETTSESPSEDDLLAIIHGFTEPSQVIRVGDANDTREGKAWMVAGKSGNAAVGLFADYGVGVPAMTPLRVVSTLMLACKETIDGVERVGGYARFPTGTVVNVYTVV